MSRIPSASPEVGVIRTYVDWLVSLPWNVSTDDRLDIREAAQILDEDHYGLEKIKERILEYLSVRTPRRHDPQPDPAVRRAPRASARPRSGKSHRQGDGPQVRPDEPRRHPRRGGDPRPPAHLHRRAARPDHPEHQDRRHQQPRVHARRGRQDRHGLPRRPVLGAARGPRPGAELQLPGQLPRGPVRPAARCCSSRRPTCSIRSRPPCATGWRSSSCRATPSRRRSRSRKRFLVPKQMENHGLTAKHIEITDEVLVAARPGLHQGGRRPEPRARAREHHAQGRPPGRGGPQAQDRRRPQASSRSTSGRRGSSTASSRPRTRPARATGLVVTEVGGDVVAVEVTLMEGKEDFILTGQLGDVMRESARAALSWIRSNAAELGIEREVFEKHTLHIHVPAGAIPKDGPSAGVTMATAMVQRLTGIPVRKDVAMTGEITLRGRVLPIGGLKSKILAAHLAGAGMVILPKKNEKDLRDIPEEIRKQLKLVTAETMDAGARCGAPASPEAPRRPADAGRRGRRRPAQGRARDPGPRARSRRPSSLRSWFSGTCSGGRRWDARCVRYRSGPRSRTPSALAAVLPGPSPRRPSGERNRRVAHRLAGRMNDGIPGLLRDPRGAEDGVPGRYQEGLPEARPRAPSGPQRRRQGRRAAVQGRERGQRGPVRPRQAQAVRHCSARTGSQFQRTGGAAARTRSGPAGRSPGSGPAAGQRRPVRQRPLRVPHGGTRRRRVLRLLPDVLLGRRAAGAGAATGRRDFAGDAGGPPADRRGTDASRTSSAEMGLDGAPPSGGPDRRPAAARRDRRAARRDRGPRRADARGGVPRHHAAVEVEGKRYEVTDPARAPTPAAGSGSRARAPSGRDLVVTVKRQAASPSTRAAAPTSSASSR